MDPCARRDTDEHLIRLIGVTLDYLSIENNGTSLHKDPCDLATSYQFCLHLDSNCTCVHT